MTFSTKADLKTNVLDYMARNELTANVDDMITLAEAHLNRELEAVEVDATLAGVPDSRRIDISSLSLVAPVALFIKVPSGDEQLMVPKADGTFPYLETSGTPSFWAIDGTNIDFDCPCDQAYEFRLRYRQKFSLVNDGDSNWLLLNHPDIYLAATLVWGSVFIKSFGDVSVYKALLEEAIPSLKNLLSQSKRTVLTIDPAIQRMGGYRNGYNSEQSV